MPILSSSKPTVLIVGTSFHTLRQYLLDHGYEYVTLRDLAITKHPEKRLKRRVVCDFSSKSQILKALDEVVARYKVDAVMATYENYIRPAAIIAEKLGLPGMSTFSAEACTDKYLMRQLFAKAPEKISPDYAVVTSEEDVRTFAASHQFPLILKPANLAKSLLVTKSNDLDELLSNYQTTMQNIDQVYKRYAPNNPPKLLIEEFMVGSIYSVDAFVDDAGEPHVLEQVVDYQTGYDVGYNDNFHYSRVLPSKLPKDQITALRQVAALGCKALGMKSSPAHVEIIMTVSGPMIVEIGARNGGYRERMHSIANGIDITGAALDLLFGRQPEITASRNDNCAVLELFPKKAGEFVQLAREAELKDLPSLVSYDIKPKVGDRIGKSSDGYKMTAMIMLHNQNTEQFNQDLAFIDQSVYVVIKD
jgi:biotin carboxylase